MEKDRPKRDIEERIGDVRDAVTDADATGLIAGEELITQAETLLPLQRPTLPQDDLHGALPSEHPAHATIDRLDAELQAAQPDRQAIEQHVGALRLLPELEAIVANWWENPRTQRFVWNLSQIGL
jgi:hypothetical protein